MKKYLIIGIIAIGLVIAGFFIPPPDGFFRGDVETLLDKVIYDPLPAYNWISRLGTEDISKRTHTTKDYATSDPTKRVLIQSSGLLHYYDGGFKDLKNLPFPEGKEITTSADKHFMLNLPEWGEAKVENNGTQVRIYDKLGTPIYIFKDPLVVPKGKNPYIVVDKNGLKVKETTDLQERTNIDEEIIKSPDTIETELLVENNKLYMKLPTGLTYPLQAYDDTDTSSSNQQDAMIRGYSTLVTYNYGASTTVDVYPIADNLQRILIHFHLSAGSGAISRIQLYLYVNAQGAATDVKINEILQTSWTEGTGNGSATGDGATWNTYNGTNNWTTAGGDFDATIIHTLSPSATAWNTWDLIETDANGAGLTLTWGDPVHLILQALGTNVNGWVSFNTKENASNVPRIEITYTPAPPAPPEEGGNTLLIFPDL